jgi:hypothetical protein
MNALRLAASLLAVSLVVTACGSGGSSPTPDAASTAPPATDAPAATTAPTPGTAIATPAPTPVPSEAPATPTPTAAPVDAANPFIRLMALLRANVGIEGTTVTGSTTSRDTGTMALASRSSDMDVTTTTGRKQTSSHVITASNLRYVTEDGLWFEDGLASDDTLAALIVGIEDGVTDVGLETRTGRDLHHLTISPPASAAAAIGVPDKGSSDVVVTIDAWVEEDGTPVYMTLGATWTQASGSTTVDAQRTVELSFTDVGTAIAVDPPDEVWVKNTSKRYGYRVAYPEDWTFEKGSKKYSDSYWGDDGDRVYIARTSASGLSLMTWSNAIQKYLPQYTGYKGVKIISNKPAKLGTLPARKIEFTYKRGGDRYWVVYYFTVKNNKLYYVDYESTSKTKAEDRATAAGFAASFERR